MDDVLQIIGFESTVATRVIGFRERNSGAEARRKRSGPGGGRCLVALALAIPERGAGFVRLPIPSRCHQRQQMHLSHTRRGA